MIIAIGNDHAGVAYKFEIITHLKKQNIQVLNFGTDTEKDMDYPDTIHLVAKAVSSKKVNFGIVICGSGNGAQMTANKHQNVRAALCWTKELVALARRHNDANILSIPARFISLSQAISFINTFLNTRFEGGRHQNRIDKINCY